LGQREFGLVPARLKQHFLHQRHGRGEVAREGAAADHETLVAGGDVDGGAERLERVLELRGRAVAGAAVEHAREQAGGAGPPGVVEQAPALDCELEVRQRRLVVLDAGHLQPVGQGAVPHPGRFDDGRGAERRLHRAIKGRRRAFVFGSAGGGVNRRLRALHDRLLHHRTPAELENAFKSLGATIDVAAGDERFVISGRTLSRNFAATMALVEEMLLEPRWDEAELALANAAAGAQLAAARAEPGAMASRVYDLVAYGPGHVLATNALGTEATRAGISMQDLQDFMQRSLAPQHARVRVVGPVQRDEALAALASLGERWQASDVAIPGYPAPTPPEASRIHFFDMPGATQSVLLFGYPALTRADPEFHQARMMNFLLGGGGFASRLMQSLREEKGYSYGFSSGFSGDRRTGHFTLGGAVRANVTLEAAELARDIVRDYGASFTAEDLETTRESMAKRRALAFETPGAKLGILAAIGDHGLAPDFLRLEAEQTRDISLEQVRDLAERHLRTRAMHYVVVGDAATQARRLEALGYGPVEMM